MIYLDNAATTAVSKKSADESDRILRACFGNPSSLYSLGIDAQRELEAARKTVAGAFGCEPSELCFTGCGTESNNIALQGSARARSAWGNEIVTTAFEHPSVQNTLRALKTEGFTVHEIKPKNGVIDIEEMLSKVGKNTVLASAMLVNNETGAITDIEALARGVKERNPRAAFHCDAVQGFTKHPLPLRSGAIDTVSASGHKLHAPKGIGALYIRKGFNLKPSQFGGGQERGMRNGTENVAFAAAFAAAVAERKKDGTARITAIRDRLVSRLKELPEIVINSPDGASPYILNFSVLGFGSETLIHFLERSGIYVSGGSACSKGHRSHTLEAMGLGDDIVESALRASFCEESAESDADALADGIERAQKTLMKHKR